MKSKVSVIVTATPKRKGELKLLLEDLEKQDYPNYEIVSIIGNMSIPQAWNIGIKQAEGDILLFTESDVSLPKDWISKMVPLVQKHGFAMGSEVLTTDRSWNMSTTGVKSKIAKNLLFNEHMKIGEDTDWFERLREKGLKIKRYKEPVVWHHKSKNIKKKLLWSFLQGKYRVHIALKYRAPEINFKRTFGSWLYYSAVQLLYITGCLWGMIRYASLMPRKIYWLVSRRRT